MKNFLKIALISTMLMVPSAAAMAFPKEGKSYFNFNLGYAINNPKVNFSTTAPTTTGSLKPMDRGFAFDAGFGYYLLDEIRLALNPVYCADMTGKATSGTGANTLTNKQKMKNYGVFANIYYDFLLGGKMNPFVLLGLGYMRTELEDLSTFAGRAGKGKVHRNKISYQLGGGLAYHLSSAIDAELGWKVLKMRTKKSNRAVADETDPIGIAVTTEPGLTNLITLGLRFTF